MLFASLNHIDNTLKRPTRPEFLALQDYTPLEAGADDCLRV